MDDEEVSCQEHDGCSNQCVNFGIEIECHENPNPDPCRDCEHRPTLTCMFVKKEDSESIVYPLKYAAWLSKRARRKNENER